LVFNLRELDVGPNGKLMNDCLKSLDVKSIDALILTHFHADHVQGLEIVRNRHEIKKIYVTWVEDPIYEVKRVREILQEFKTTHMKAGDSINLGEMVIQCLWPTTNKIEIGSIPNNSSIFLIMVQGFRIQSLRNGQKQDLL